MYNDIITIAVVTTFAFLALYYWWFRVEVEGRKTLLQKDMKPQMFNIVILLCVAFVIKAIIAVKNEGYVGDINCFKSWSETAYEYGISKFYYIDEGNGYPPGYLAVLWVVAAIRHLFGIDNGSNAGMFMIKLVPMLCDLGAGFVLYLLSKKRFSEGISLTIALIYVLNPAIIIDSSVWGQVDSVFVLTLLITCWLCMEKKRIPAYFVFCLGALLKFQTIMFAPILIFTIIEQVFLNDFSVKKMLKDLVGGICAIGAMFVFAIPFGLDVVVPKYINSLELFEYCSVNAYNFWAIIGKNWAPQTDKFLFLQCERWGSIAIVVAVLVSGFVFFKMKKDKSKYFLSMAVLISIVFMFSVRMHERYLFPVIVLTLAGFLIRPTKELFLAFIGFTVVQFLNVAHVFYAYKELGTTGPTGYIIGAVSVATLFFMGYLLYGIFRKQDVVYEAKIMQSSPSKKRNNKNNNNVAAAEKKEKVKFSITPTKLLDKMTKKDFIILFAIMAVYSCFAFHDLGNNHAPETAWEAKQPGTQLVFDFGEQKNITSFYAFAGCYEGRSMNVEVSDDNVNYTLAGTVRVSDVFKWNDVKFVASGGDDETTPININARYVRMTTIENEITLNEIVFKDSEGNFVVPANSSNYTTLFDEQDEFDPELTFRSGTYFDEIYHARTAFEMVHKLYNYENTHPPLGKFFISLGVRTFGMNPFGWRIVGTLFGIGMLPFMYLFGKRLFRQTWVAGVVTTLFAFDFMHFTQTRIATIDVYGTFFIIAMFYFMLRYAQTSFYDTDLKKTFIPLGLSGLMMGLGCASKWTAIYAGAGLGVLFAAIMFGRYMEYRAACRDPYGNTAGISHRHVMDVFKPNMIKTLCVCVVFFVIIPGTIYLLSYIPFSDGTTDNLLMQMIHNQKSMYSYHSTLKATHPYSSTWYEWPTMIKPVFYYCNTVAGDLKEGISAFGNPLVWWAGIFAFIYMVYRSLKKRDRVSIFLCFTYLVQYLPWVLVPRCTFAYHYFPSVPFVTLMIGYALYCFIGDNKNKRILAYVYCAIAIALFILFYPVLSGQPVSTDFVNNGLKWLPGWVLIL